MALSSKFVGSSRGRRMALQDTWSPNNSHTVRWTVVRTLEVHAPKTNFGTSCKSCSTRLLSTSGGCVLYPRGTGPMQPSRFCESAHPTNAVWVACKRLTIATLLGMMAQDQGGTSYTYLVVRTSDFACSRPRWYEPHTINSLSLWTAQRGGPQHLTSANCGPVVFRTMCGTLRLCASSPRLRRWINSCPLLATETS